MRNHPIPDPPVGLACLAFQSAALEQNPKLKVQAPTNRLICTADSSLSGQTSVGLQKNIDYEGSRPSGISSVPQLRHLVHQASKARGVVVVCFSFPSTKVQHPLALYFGARPSPEIPILFPFSLPALGNAILDRQVMLHRDLAFRLSLFSVIPHTHHTTGRTAKDSVTAIACANFA